MSKKNNEKRVKLELREAIDNTENFLEKLKGLKVEGVTTQEIDSCIRNLDIIIKAIRGYHTGVTGLLTSFEQLYSDLQGLKTKE